MYKKMKINKCRFILSSHFLEFAAGEILSAEEEQKDDVGEAGGSGGPPVWCRRRVDGRGLLRQGRRWDPVQVGVWDSFKRIFDGEVGED